MTAPDSARSKEISKASVIDDVVGCNPVLYPNNEHPDHIVVIKYVPKCLFTILANLPKIKKQGKRDVILFSRFTLSHDLVGKDVVGEASFKEYIKKSF